ncbi:MAG: hypothetical protein MH825_02300 [Cyanobacteria bacterium]|nr:hypothetical protein [Cyanobacteriota bacterium]
MAAPLIAPLLVVRAAIAPWSNAVGRPPRSQPWRLFTLLMLLGSLGALVPSPSALAQFSPFDFLTPLPPDEFEPSPLELQAADPLLPAFPLTQPLTAAQIAALRPELANLDRAAVADFRAGRRVEAFSQWNRYLRLMRYVGPIDEARSLGRVGAIAWRSDEIPQARFILERLKELEAAMTGNVALLERRPALPKPDPAAVPPQDTPDQREAIAIAYGQVGQPKAALRLYDPLVAAARAGGDRGRLRTLLEAVAPLAAQSFDYERAIAAYQDLLRLEREQPSPIPPERELDPAGGGNGLTLRQPPIIPRDRLWQVTYLQHIITLAERSQKPDISLPARQDLANLYREVGAVRLLPTLQTAIAADYLKLDRPAEAESLYRRGSLLAQQLRQFDVAREAVSAIAELYRTHPAYGDRRDEVAGFYVSMLTLAREAGDGYAMMDTYDRLGEFFVERQERDRARTSFEQGLLVAQQLQHRVSHFERRLQSLDQAPAPTSPTPDGETLPAPQEDEEGSNRDRGGFELFDF